MKGCRCPRVDVSLWDKRGMSFRVDTYEATGLAFELHERRVLDDFFSTV
jgi:hypothetical protein